MHVAAALRAEEAGVTVQLTGRPRLQVAGQDTDPCLPETRASFEDF